MKLNRTAQRDAPHKSGSISCEDNLRAGGQLIKLTDRKHFLDLWTKILRAQMKHIHRRFACEYSTSCVMDHRGKLALGRSRRLS
jgi:hypothetical protein